MTDIRLLQTGHRSAAFNMALDEVLIQRIAEGKSKPSLRFYGWEPKTVSIGYFQSLEAEVDLARCKEWGVDVVRRQTGGGAVFHDDEITYSLHLPLALKLVPEKILDSYAAICQGLILGLKPLGIEAQFVPLNDLIVKGQKISGNAQTRRQGILLQHGTLLRGLDVDRMFDLLKVPDEKMKGKLIATIKERVTAIDRHCIPVPSFDAVVQALISGFEQAFPQSTFVPGSLTTEETDAVHALAKQKYTGDNWNRQR